MLLRHWSATAVVWLVAGLRIALAGCSFRGVGGLNPVPIGPVPICRVRARPVFARLGGQILAARFRVARLVVIGLGAACLCLAPPGHAAQRSGPAWWDPDGVGTGSDWHYRVAVTLPSTSAVSSTAKVDVDFAALMVQLGISGTFDANSVRVVRPGGAIATVQEFNDTIYGGATNATTTRGEVRWLVEDGGAQTYQIYFDITQNGAKSANPQTPINGNFEHASTGTQLPAGWASATKSNAAYDMQIRPSESVAITSDGNPADNPKTTDGTPRTGGKTYLLGARSNNEPATGTAQIDATVLTRTITVPATNPGNLTINWRVEGWDSATNGATTYDNLHVRIVTAGGATTEIVGPATNDYGTYPFSPNYGANPAGALNSGYGVYNKYDIGGLLRSQGMSVPSGSERWWSRTYSLAAFAGQTVTLSIATSHTELYRTWFHVDDVEWAVVSASVGSAEGFGVGITFPTGSLAPGQTPRILATVDAKPTGTVNANVYDALGNTVMGNVLLYNDGAHGDGAASDAVWGSDPYLIPLNTPSSAGWTARIYARDLSTTTQGTGFNGLVHRNGLPTTQVMANWWNIDEVTFRIDAAVISVAKTSTILSDGVNTSNFKFIPGATLRYCVTIGNAGTATATTVIATDSLPTGLGYVAGTLASGSACASATTPEDDDASGADESDPVGASWAGGTVSIVRPSLAPSTSFAVTYNVLVQ